ncbi:MAG: hypothetical protein ACLUOI_39125 [Eisenbergiella sp.]
MPALYDGNGEAAVTFSNDGYVLHGDLFGRGKEDVIIYSGKRPGFTAVRSLNRENAFREAGAPGKETLQIHAVSRRGEVGNVTAD